MNIPSKPNHFPPDRGPDRMGPPPMMNIDHIKRKWLDVAYANQSSTQKLDIYLPDTGNGPFPVICEFHGGAWLFGDKRDDQQVPMLRGLKKGYAIVCINYRLSGEAIFPSQIFDCKAAIRFIKKNAKQYKLDPEKIGVWGASAGAHLVSLLGTSAGVKELEDLSMGNADINSAVQAVVDWCGPTESFLKMDEEFKMSGLGIANHSSLDSPESKLLGRHITEVPGLVEFASPKMYANKDIPPFFIQHGSLDQVVPVEQSINFASTLAKAAGVAKVQLEIIAGLHHHGDPAWDTVEMSNKVFHFFDQVFKK
jgi:acetyl esterase/lipase